MNGIKKIKLPIKIEGHAYHLFVVQVSNRKKLYDFLKSKNIYCQIHYLPIHLQPYYLKKGFKKGNFPIVEKYYENCISLPIYPTLSEKEQEYIIKQIKLFYNEH